MRISPFTADNHDRMGIAAGAPPIIHLLNTIKPPYNVSSTTAYFARQAFTPSSLERKSLTIGKLVAERDRMVKAFLNMEDHSVDRILGGQDANFLLIQVKKVDDPRFGTRNDFAMAIYQRLAEDPKENVVIRFRGKELHCDGCLRASIGTKEENDLLLRKWSEAVSALLAKQ